MSPVVLASTSPYRRALLERLNLRFEALGPHCDETPLAGESPAAQAARLAEAKARAVAGRRPGSVIIGSDQVASCGADRLGKPGDHAQAVAQLARQSGQSVDFHTAVCVLDANGQARVEVDLTRVHFRRLSAAEIEAYLRAERPYDCAGSFKSEGLGITLFEAIETRDPSALVGLPLIATARLLRAAGIRLP